MNRLLNLLLTLIITFVFQDSWGADGLAEAEIEIGTQDEIEEDVNLWLSISKYSMYEEADMKFWGMKWDK